MFEAKRIDAQDLARFYADLDSQLRALLAGERDLVAELNWAGFYFLQSPDELVVGPFQGKPACVRIPVGKGVCGAAVARGASILVDDVHAFPGHIACDGASQSELVVPLLARGQLPDARIPDARIFGVLDLDSPVKRRFTDADRIGFERLAATFVEASDWP